MSDNNISTTDVEQYDEWMSDHDISFYSVQEEGKVIYNKSNVDKLISPAKNMYDYRFTGSYELPVQFADIEAEVFIYTGFTINYICLFNYLFISSQMSAKPYFIGSTGILPLW